jgi:vancomycin resistance protein VanJ
MTLSRLYLYALTLVRFIQRLIIAATQLYVLGILGWHILRAYPGDRWFPVLLGSYLAPWLMLPLLPALGVALLGRRRWLAMLTLLAILSSASRYSYLLLPKPVIAEAKGNTLKVMTFNVHYANRNAAPIVAMIRREKPDIIAFQEFTQDMAILIQPELKADYPYTVDGYRGGFALVIASRYPLAEAARPPEALRTLRATVQTPAGVIDLWNIHPMVALSSERRQAQREIMAAVAAEVARTEGPVMVLGDFNTMDQAENYELIAKRLTDVHQVVGQGFGFTFPDLVSRPSPLPWYTKPLYLFNPMVRIDHIMVSEHFTPREIQVISDVLGSDHRPVVASLYLKP